MGNIFFEVTIVVCLAAFLTIIFRLLKQPPILAYILTGIIVGPFGQLQLANQHVLMAMGEFGITLLLFILGLEFRLRELRSVGTSALVIGTLQLIVTSLSGYALSVFLGFSQIASFYIGIALAFSSTIVVVTILSDKKDLPSLYGKITIGILLVQDFFAIVALMFLSGFTTNAGAPFSLVHATLLRGFLFLSFVAILSKSILPRLLHLVARSPDTLLLFSLAWVFSLVLLTSSTLIGLPIAIGGLLAGISLANTPESLQIAARVRSLRDFFLTIFFVTLGMDMQFDYISGFFLPGILLSLFVLLGKPVIVMSIMGLMGHRLRLSFLTGLNMAQISEFSLIIVFFGNRIHHVTAEVVSVVTFIGILSFIFSAYAIAKNKRIYTFAHKYLGVFEKDKGGEEDYPHSKEEIGTIHNHVVLVGAHQMGESILAALKEEGEKVIVIDFNPDIVKTLREKGITHFFGDIADVDIQERAKLDLAKLVISTAPDKEDNMLLITSLMNRKVRPKIVVMAQSSDDAKALYEAGADYVIIPHLASGLRLAKILKGNHLDKIEKLRLEDLVYLP